MTSEVFYHLGFGQKSFSGKAPTTCILSGDPERAERIAKEHLKNSSLLSEHRGLKFFSGETPSGELVISGTSGMGASSMSIIVNELYMLGVRKIIRVGTSGSIQASVKTTDIVISQAALCTQGAADDIAPRAFPAAADPKLSLALCEAANELKLRFHMGVTASVDTFYEGQERSDGAKSSLMRKHQGLIEEYRNLGVLNFEMESGSLFKMGLVYGFQAACVCAIIAERNKSESVEREKIAESVDNAIQVAVKSIA